jgi:serine/threonine protein kinase
VAPTRLPPHAQDAAGEATLGRFGSYVLLRRIGVGGMSEVFLARPVEGAFPARELVVKRLLPELLLDPDGVEAFALEARLHEAARHPCVTRVYESGFVEGEPYLALEHVDGVDLSRLQRHVARGGAPLPAQVAALAARDIARALTCVHALRDESGRALRVVHRDVTPSNVLLSRAGHVKLCDFGIARSAARQSSLALKGKYTYLAPEQVAGEPFDHRADLFSLGVMLAEMLIGEPLYTGSNPLAVLLAIQDARVERLRAKAHLIPPALLPIVERLLAKSPAQRPASARIVVDELSPFVGDERQAAALLSALVADVLSTTPLGRIHEPRGRPGEAAPLDGLDGELGGLDAELEGDVTSEVPERLTQPSPEPSLARVRMSTGRRLENVPYSKVVELIATGQLGPDDQVAFESAEFRPVARIEGLARHLRGGTGSTTRRLEGPGVPDFAVQLPGGSMLDCFAWLLKNRETGALFADGGPEGVHKEAFLDEGRVVTVTSTEHRELLGEYLVRQGLLQRDELELALVVLPTYDGRLGDTLLALGLVDAVDLFRAIRNQGRDRLADMFKWSEGRAVFYRGERPDRVEFKLDLELSQVLFAGLGQLEGAGPSEIPRPDPATDRSLDLPPLPSVRSFAPAERVRLVKPLPAFFARYTWPLAVTALLGSCEDEPTVDELYRAMQGGLGFDESVTRRSLLLATAVGLVELG